MKTVRWTPLYKWICRGDSGHFVIKRVHANPPLSDEILKQLKTAGEQFLGKDYDWYFDWSNDKIYCSELVWKTYYNLTGLEIGKLQQINDLDLTNELVKTKMKERYGEKIPFDEKIITPASIFNSDLLITVDQK